MPVDLEAAAHWREKAAKGGSVVAQYLLGTLYLEGRGVPKDVQAADAWARKALMRRDLGPSIRQGAERLVRSLRGDSDGE